MNASLLAYLTQYGYWAVFSLVFLQEIGVPNPVPNEVILLFSGYLVSIKAVSFPIMFLVALGADFIGTALLFFIFYYFGSNIMKIKFLAKHQDKIATISHKVSTRGWWGIYLGRLVPYIRGYTSVAAGIMRVRPRIYLTAVLCSAITWSGGYVVVGTLLGKNWDIAIQKIGGVNNFAVIFVVIVIGFFLTRYLYQKRKVNQ